MDGGWKLGKLADDEALNKAGNHEADSRDL
jgi:hypothetical protein